MQRGKWIPVIAGTSGGHTMRRRDFVKTGALLAGTSSLLPPQMRADVTDNLFDRVSVAQATVEGVTLLTIDSLVAQCPGPKRTVMA